MARLTVSPSCWASARQTGRLSCTTSSRALAAPASRTMPTPSRNLPLAAPWVTSSRQSSAASSRDAVDLCTPSSRATSVTPASPSRARISRMAAARSTDWTAPAPPAPLLPIAQRYLLTVPGLGVMAPCPRLAGVVGPQTPLRIALVLTGGDRVRHIVAYREVCCVIRNHEDGYERCAGPGVCAHAVLPGQAGDRVRGVQLPRPAFGQHPGQPAVRRGKPGRPVLHAGALFCPSGRCRAGRARARLLLGR